MRIVLIFFMSLSLIAPLAAYQPDEVLKDPALEARARDLSQELRCLVCQNQSIDDSDAPLARDLRILVRDRLKAGDSDAAVKDFVVARYGEFVLLKPTFGLHTFLLWALPFLLLAAGILLIYNKRSVQTASNAQPKALSAEEKAKLDKLLKG